MEEGGGSEEGEEAEEEEAEGEEAEEMEEEEEDMAADQFDLAKVFAEPTYFSVVSTFCLTSKDSLRSQLLPMNGSVLTSG